MANYNEIKEGQQVRYFGHTCKVVRKTKSEEFGTRSIHLVYPNPLMIDVNCIVQSKDDNFEDIDI